MLRWVQDAKTAERHGPTSSFTTAIGGVNNKTGGSDNHTVPSTRKMRREIFLLLYCLEAVRGAAHPAPTPAARLEQRSPTGLLNVESVWAPLTLGVTVICIVWPAGINIAQASNLSFSRRASWLCERSSFYTGRGVELVYDGCVRVRYCNRLPIRNPLLFGGSFSNLVRYTFQPLNLDVINAG